MDLFFFSPFSIEDPDVLFFFSVQVMVPYYAAVGQLPAEESNWIGIAMVIIIVVYIYI